jgi:hypothetical protein
MPLLFKNFLQHTWVHDLELQMQMQMQMQKKAKLISITYCARILQIQKECEKHTSLEETIMGYVTI